jgi:hypothetical protein
MCGHFNQSRKLKINNLKKTRKKMFILYLEAHQFNPLTCLKKFCVSEDNEQNL